MRVLAAVFALLVAPPVRAQTGTLVGIIAARESGERLAHSIVSVPALGRAQFSSDSGVFILYALPAGVLDVHVRRIGYRPVELSARIDVGGTDTIVVELTRVALNLEEVHVRAHPPCTEPGAPGAGADPAMAAAFQQLRLNAEQFNLLAAAYPFAYAMEKTVSQRSRRTGEVKVLRQFVEPFDSRAHWAYRPGEVITRSRGNAYFRIPTLRVIADDRFVAAHCFHYGGLSRVNDEELLRIDVVASERIRGPDVNGSLFLHPSTFQIRRTLFSLSRRPTFIRDLAHMEVETWFREIMPSIPVISYVSSQQVLDARARGDVDAQLEAQWLAGFRFLQRHPGDQRPE